MFNLMEILIEYVIGEELYKKLVDLIFIRVGPLFSVLYVDLKCPLSE
jgi:hypothetical protein